MFIADATDADYMKGANCITSIYGCHIACTLSSTTRVIHYSFCWSGVGWFSDDNQTLNSFWVNMKCNRHLQPRTEYIVNATISGQTQGLHDFRNSRMLQGIIGYGSTPYNAIRPVPYQVNEIRERDQCWQTFLVWNTMKKLEKCILTRDCHYLLQPFNPLSFFKYCWSLEPQSSSQRIKVHSLHRCDFWEIGM